MLIEFSGKLTKRRRTKNLGNSCRPKRNVQTLKQGGDLDRDRHTVWIDQKKDNSRNAQAQHWDWDYPRSFCLPVMESILKWAAVLGRGEGT